MCRPVEGEHPAPSHHLVQADLKTGLRGRAGTQPAAQWRRPQARQLLGYERRHGRLGRKAADRHRDPASERRAARIVGRDLFHPVGKRPGAQQVDDIVEHRQRRAGGSRVGDREHVGQARLAAQPGGVTRLGPVDHAHDKRCLVRGVAAAQRLVVPGPSRPEHLQRCPGGRAHCRK